ncbi:hypothetical protein GPECTOR_39g373 [Gonium pectorale]|uniref:MAT1 centre domain-containing protein n=1 Tax=Gonium pectorale TaxID=33097 RepID=A0A150GAL6_GONPE|nr:hypothetical protein GPECTOR_39g373 [Gonium pectorale]|eukprot:KXZ46879.1 hypothetical protein GPECTOR_39g373 [Gonium pectorale]
MDIDLEKELKVRKRILAIYTKEREDFPSKEAFDDYLEEVEDIIWRLASNVDIERTEAQANMDVVSATQLDAAALAAAASRPPATAPPMTGGLPSLLPRLAGDHSALLEGGNIRYGKQPERGGPDVAAAGGWTAGVGRSRLAAEALASLLPPVRLVEGLGC